MRQFSSIDLQRNTSTVQEAALQAPVAITFHGRARLVLMSAESYDRLSAGILGPVDAAEIPPSFAQSLERPLDAGEKAAMDAAHASGDVEYLPEGASAATVRELQRKHERSG